MKKICFKVDANKEIGQGHIMRCMAVAVLLRDCWEVECHFIVSDDDTLQSLEAGGFICHCLNKDYRDYSMSVADATLAYMCEINADIIVADSYDVTDTFISKLQERAKVACFWCRESYISAALIINYNIDYRRGFYDDLYAGRNTRLLLGLDYIPLREEFWKESMGKLAEEVRSVLVLTGGGDNQDFIEKFVAHIQCYGWCTDIRFTFILGKYSRPVGCIAGEELHYIPENVRIIPNTPDVLSVMKESNLVVSAGGTTVYELCALGVPSIIFSIADNQVGEAEYLNEHGIIPYAGDSREAGFWDRLFLMLCELVYDRSKRETIAGKMSGLVDGKGAERIAEALMELEKES